MCDVIQRRPVAGSVSYERRRTKVVSKAVTVVLGRSSIATQTESDASDVNRCCHLGNTTTASRQCIPAEYPSQQFHRFRYWDRPEDQCCQLDFVPWPCRQLLQNVDRDPATAAAAVDDDDDGDGLSFNTYQTEFEVYVRQWLR